MFGTPLPGATNARAQAGDAGAPCAVRAFEGRSYVVCVAPARSDLRLFFATREGEPLGTFAAVRDALGRSGETLVFAMNAGMYNPDLTPSGLYVEAGVQRKAANQKGGAGNFHMKPNGVFWIAQNGERGVTETGRYLARKIQPAYATQSGPMLVIGGDLHPRIREDGTSRKIRNGVGACAGGRTAFAISNEPVTFHEFAVLFRDALDCPDALYLDGSISAIYAPGVGRHDRWRPMGPIVGWVEKGK
jgi:uncharacterized protein YigE (DUF2233 family)